MLASIFLLQRIQCLRNLKIEYDSLHVHFGYIVGCNIWYGLTHPFQNALSLRWNLHMTVHKDLLVQHCNLLCATYSSLLERNISNLPTSFDEIHTFFNTFLYEFKIISISPCLMDFSTIHMQKGIFTWMFVYVPKCTKSVSSPRISELP